MRTSLLYLTAISTFSCDSTAYDKPSATAPATDSSGAEASTTNTGPHTTPTTDSTSPTEGTSTGTGTGTSTSAESTMAMPTTGTEFMCGDGLEDGESCDLPPRCLESGIDESEFKKCIADSRCFVPCVWNGGMAGYSCEPLDGECPEAKCGDGQVNQSSAGGGPEVCDLGSDKISGMSLNDGAYNGCAEDCMSLGPHCGDGATNGEEECDDGNAINDDACRNDCISNCGDGTKQPGEACDHGDKLSGDGCSWDCKTTEEFVIFVTTSPYHGLFDQSNFKDAITFANKKCDEAAAKAKPPLTGKYEAILSSSVTDPVVDARDALLLKDVLWIRRDGKPIAKSADLFKKGMTALSNPINITETGAELVVEGEEKGLVWTGTNPDGSASFSNCDGWTSNLKSYAGTVGNVKEVGPKWIQEAFPQACDTKHHLYCFRAE